MEDRGRVDKSEDVVVIVRPNMLTTNSARRWNRFAERVKEKDKRAIRISKGGEFIRALFSEKPASPAPEGEKAAETATEKEEKVKRPRDKSRGMNGGNDDVTMFTVRGISNSLR